MLLTKASKAPDVYSCAFYNSRRPMCPRLIGTGRCSAVVPFVLSSSLGVTALQRLASVQPRVSFVWAVIEVNEKRPADVLLTVLLEVCLRVAPARLITTSGREVPKRMTGSGAGLAMVSSLGVFPPDSFQCWSEFRVGFGCCPASAFSVCPHTLWVLGPGLT